MVTGQISGRRACYDPKVGVMKPGGKPSFALESVKEQLKRRQARTGEVFRPLSKAFIHV